jgi:chitinase
MKRIRFVLAFVLILSIAAFTAILYTKEINKAQAAGNIYINDTSITLEVDHYKTIRVHGTSSSIYWSSGNSRVASVSGTGKVFANTPGTTTITASVAGRKITCKVNVIAINKKTLTLSSGNTFTLKITGAKSTPIWSSGNTKVVTVSNDGVVTAVASGTATITATVDGKEVISKITVIDISNKGIVMEVGGWSGAVKTLKVNGTASKITWSSSNNSVATVSVNGRVNALSYGSATIIATVDGAKLTCQVKVVQMSNSTVTLKKGETFKLSIYGTTSDIKWASYKKSVAVVSADGTVTAIKAGKATIVGVVDGRIVRSKITVIE